LSTPAAALKEHLGKLSMNNSRPIPFYLLIVLAVFGLCCLCAFGIAAISLGFSFSSTPTAQGQVGTLEYRPTATISKQEVEPTLSKPPTSQATLSSPNTQILPTSSGITQTFTETLDVLENTIVPINDPIDLAERLEGKQDLPTSLQTPLKNYQIGDQLNFWVINSDTTQNFQVPATLRYQTDHVNFWIEDGVRYGERQLKALVDTFENKIYPTDREFFGSEWTPGVDADPHLFILYARGLGGSVAGYFSSADEYLPIVREYSNAHEMFLLSADIVDLGEQYAYSTLAHEFQHMIHWYRDRNEETWMNEGSSDLAAFLNGYSIGGHDQVFAADPDIQLTDWPSNSNETAAHYGGSFLFMDYFLDRFGEQATKALVADPENGMVSIDDVLSKLAIKDPSTGEQITADDVFTDWLIANYVQDESVADGRYAYHNYPAAPDVAPTEKVSKCPTDLGSNAAHQYGVNYIQITCRGDYNLHFEGQQTVQVSPEDPHSGSYAYFSNRGDESDMTLTREFDFTQYSGSLTLSYWTWYDLEADYDYLYLEASEDGKDWQILITPSGTANDPSGNSYGWGYNGVSGGGPQWIQEKVDLSRFAGKKIQLRFEYVTDEAVNGEGFLVDDISVPETGYFTDFEQDSGGWQGDGFVRIQNLLPQTYRLALINIGSVTTVEILPPLMNNVTDIPIQIGADVRSVVLVVTGTSRFTRLEAIYSLSIRPK
jgi:immune inhibitor A